MTLKQELATINRCSSLLTRAQIARDAIERIAELEAAIEKNCQGCGAHEDWECDGCELEGLKKGGG